MIATINAYIIKNGKFILNWKNKPSGLYNAKYVGFALNYFPFLIYTMHMMFTFIRGVILFWLIGMLPLPYAG